MKLTNLVISLATFATITLSSSAYIATKEVTSAVLVDKAKHSLDLTTNGLHNISVSEAFTIDKSEAAQINFLRCSFARPEFRFSWFCHQMKKDGKMTKNSYVALKDDQQKYFKTNVFKSIAYEARRLFEQAEQLSTLAKIQRAHKKANEKAEASGAAHLQNKVYSSDLDSIMKETEANESKATGVKGEAGVLNEIVEVGRVLTKTDTNIVSTKSLKDLNIEALKEFSVFKVYERLAGSDRTGLIDWNKDFEQAGTHDHSIVNMILNQDKQVLDNLGLVAADTDSTKHAGLGQKKHKINDRIFVCCMVSVLLTMLIILFVSLYKDAEDFCKGIKEVFGKNNKERKIK